MGRLIDADKLKHAIHCAYSDDLGILEKIDEQPTACYLPVTLLSKKMPKIGMLMIPKTCAYVWMIVMGLQLLF